MVLVPYRWETSIRKMFCTHLAQECLDNYQKKRKPDQHLKEYKTLEPKSKKRETITISQVPLPYPYPRTNCIEDKYRGC
jgi:hypothetical protein